MSLDGRPPNRTAGALVACAGALLVGIGPAYGQEAGLRGTPTGTPERGRGEEERRIAEPVPKMVRIEGGCFQMGSPEWELFREYNERLHEVCVEGFSIGKYEVTIAEYDRFAEATGRRKQAGNRRGWGRRPAAHRSWEDATAYARWLSEETGLSFRLPTEAEWEYAARAGSQSAFPWGDSIDRCRANVRGCRESRWDYGAAPVGSFEANAWGLHDMLGNV